MTDDTRRPPDDNPEDRDMPIKRPTASDHRPDQGDDGSKRPATQGSDPIPLRRRQHEGTKMPHPSRLQKQQRSPNMNTEKNK